MPFKTLLCTIGMHQKDRDLDLASKICAIENAHLSVFVVSVASSVPLGTYADVISDSWYVERQRDAAKISERSKEVEGLLANRNISFDVSNELVELAFIADSIGRRARHADLTLFGPSLLADDAIRDQSLDGALFRSGRSVLMLPESDEVTLKPEVVSVAWDGSVEAARAIAASIDMLRTADSVRLVLVDPIAGDGAHGPEPGADLAAYLSRHDIRIDLDRMTSNGRPVANVIMQHAIDNHSELIVMGAYGHSRLRERIFGGVTRDILSNVKVPILMAH